MVMYLYTARITIRFMAVANYVFVFGFLFCCIFFLFLLFFFFGGGAIGRQLLVVVSTLVDLFLGLEIVRTNEKFTPIR